MLPGAQQVGAVVVDGAAAEEGVEDGVAEGELEGAESGGGLVGGDRVEQPVAIEDPARDEGVDVGVEGQQRPETLRCGDQGGDGSVEVREPRREVVAHDGVGGAAEEAGEAAVEEEGGAQHLGDREDEGEVGEGGLGEAGDGEAR